MLIITVVAAVVTPTPDATTMLVFMLPMVGLYLLAWACRTSWSAGRRAKALAGSEAQPHAEVLEIFCCW